MFAIILFLSELNNSLTATVNLATEFIIFLTENIKLSTEFNIFKPATNNLQTSTLNKRKKDRKAAYNMVYIQLLLMALLRKFRASPKVKAYLQSTGIFTKYRHISGLDIKKPTDRL